ncbi:MAG: polysaccharide biosynthesis/export family protein [Bacteroidia bacterium]|nr:polysaccharide biosynthesis/export family protein [Bacteroidia bacterium]
MKKIHPLILFVLSLPFLFSSCVTSKKFNYLQNKSGSQNDSNGVIKTQNYNYKLQNGDILYLSLSTDDERLNKIFIPNVSGQMNQQSQGTAGTPFYYTGFTIDGKGEVELPYLGKVSVTGKTIEEAKIAMEESLRKYFKVFYLQVKVAEFKFSVIGYVNRPGQFFFTQNKVNIIEAIAQAGDLQELAKKYEVHLYRLYSEGVKLHVLDLTDRSLISSPYWYIQPGDVLYVQPLKMRSVGNLTSLQSSFNVVAPLLSSLLLVLNTYILVKNLK